jgi:hypothetical protein
VEQAAEVGRNDKGGTCARCGNLVPKGAARFFGIGSSEQGSDREWTRSARAGGGAISGNPKRGVRNDPEQAVEVGAISIAARPAGRDRKGRTAKLETCLRWRCEGVEGCAEVFSIWRRSRAWRTSKVSAEAQGHGGRVGKANDPHHALLSAKPRLDPWVSVATTPVALKTPQTHGRPRRLTEGLPSSGCRHSSSCERL